MDPRSIWRFIRKQGAPFWMINAYLFLEYVRPQSVWPSLDILPWAQFAIILATVSLLMSGKGVSLPTFGGVALMIFTAVVLISSVTAYDPSASQAKLIDYFLWVLIIVLIVNIIKTEGQFAVFFLAFLLYSYKMSQFGFRQFVERGAGFATWGATGAPGWFHNSGEFGIQMCVFIPMATAYMGAMYGKWPRWKLLFLASFPLTGLVSIVASSSRGALVGIAVVMAWYVVFVRKKQRMRAIVGVGVVALATWLLVPDGSRERFDSAGEDETSNHRYLRWGEGMEMARRYPVFGVGYENWTVYHKQNFPRGYDSLLAHNIFIQIVAELGYVGLFCYILMFASTFWVNFRTRRLSNRSAADTQYMKYVSYGLDGALVGFAVSGSFITVAYYPYFWINLALTIALHRAMKRKVGQARRRAHVAAMRQPHVRPSRVRAPQPVGVAVGP